MSENAVKDAIIGMAIDRSGSMASMWEEAVAGVNTFKNEQAGATTWITINYFDHQHGQKYYAWAAKDIPDLSAQDPSIYPRGMTALVDAVIRIIEDTDKWLTDNDWFDGQVYVVVVTDGRENASEASPAALKEMVQAREARGWTFVYLAANVDLEATGKNLGFDLSRSMAYDDGSVAAAYATASASVLRSRAGDTGDLFREGERDVRQGASRE